ncbi:MAG TPA: hypothetical protein VI279_13105 [Rhodocyclaceae bacterium]
MNPITYEAIEPNIATVEVEGAQVRVTWKCSQTGREVGQSSATMAADASTAGRVKSSVERSIASELINGLARFITGLVGGPVGRVVRNATYTAASDLNARAVAASTFTEASKKAAIVRAFDSVSASFEWNEQKKAFVAK